MVDLVQLQKSNAARWAIAKITRGTFYAVAQRLAAPAAKARYKAVEARTGVPWYFIAVAHEREASQNWNTQLGQGDPLNKVSVHVPAGRGPFATWEDGAYDALVNCAPFAARNRDWSVGGTLTMLERYNGLGYAARGLPSPYIWSGTDQYVRGKYVRDGVFDPNAVDQQLGCAGLLKAMQQIDPSVMAGTNISQAPVVQPRPVTPPPVANPANVSNNQQVTLGSFLKYILSIFVKRK